MPESPKAPRRPFEHVANLRRPQVIESYCPSCGVFVAASSSLQTLELAESAHTCAKWVYRQPSETGNA